MGEEETSIDQKLAQVNSQLAHKLQDFSAQDLNGVSPPLIAPCIECRAGFHSIAVLFNSCAKTITNTFHMS